MRAMRSSIFAKSSIEIVPFAPTAFPVEFLALGGIGPGVPVRATVSDFGPQLLAKVLGANETQEQSLSLVFHFADEHGHRGIAVPAVDDRAAVDRDDVALARPVVRRDAVHDHRVR